MILSTSNWVTQDQLARLLVICIWNCQCRSPTCHLCSLAAACLLNRYTSFTTITDDNQTRSEWVDIDIEMETKLNQAYEEVRWIFDAVQVYA